MKLALVRHGETDWNRVGRIQGRINTSLNQVGREQARTTGRELASLHSWTGVVSSPMTRATETAEIIASEILSTVKVTLDGLVEQDFGEAEGRYASDLDSEMRLADFGAETASDVGARGLAALEECALAFPTEDLVVVTHGSLIRCVLSGVLRLPIEQLPLVANASIFTLDRIDSRWVPSVGAGVNGSEVRLPGWTSE